MSEAGGVTHEILKRMLQRVLDAQEHERIEMRIMRRELARIDRTLTALQRSEIDRIDALTDVEERLDAIARRVDHLEDQT